MINERKFVAESLRVTILTHTPHLSDGSSAAICAIQAWVAYVEDGPSCSLLNKFIGSERWFIGRATKTRPDSKALSPQEYDRCENLAFEERVNEVLQMNRDELRELFSKYPEGRWKPTKVSETA